MKNQSTHTENTHVLDASGKKIGRVATAAAVLLMGKNKADYVRNNVVDVKVSIINTSKASVDAKKVEQKLYKNYSGYPGGLKETSVTRLVEKKGYSELFKKAVYGMLPKNKLRSRMILNLTISE
jgi:large subunit ribosomal protein L13